LKNRIVGVVCGLLLASTASAEPVTFQFTGVLPGVTSTLGGDLEAGDQFSYTLGLDITDRYSRWLDFEGSIGDWAFQGVGGGSFYSFQDSIRGELHSFRPGLVSADPIGPYQVLGAWSVWEYDPGVLTPQVLDGTLPLPVPTSATLRVLFGTQSPTAPLDWDNGPQVVLTSTSIPEPSTLLCMLVAVSGMVVRRMTRD
jgi:hypothetical protein